MTTPRPDAAALATELAYLVDLPVEQRGPKEGARYDQVRWALADIDPADRMNVYAAAVAAIDPGHVLGPYPNLATAVLTVELYAFEDWRLSRIYSSDEARADTVNRLLLVTEPLFHSWPPAQIFAYTHVRALLKFRGVTADDFPEFSLRDHLQGRGVNLDEWDSAAQTFGELAQRMADEVEQES